MSEGDGRVRNVSVAARLRYGFDNFLSGGTVALVLALFALTAVIIVVASVVVSLAGWVSDEEGGFITVLWRALLATIDPALIGGEHGSAPFLLSLLAVTFAGIFVTSILIGILVSGIEGRLAELRRGRSRVIESGHTVILGWSQQVFTVLEALIAANTHLRRSAIVILANKDTLEMHDEIRSRVGPTGRTRVVCRTGDPDDIGDLELVNLQAAKSIIVLSPSTAVADASVVKTIVAITNSPTRRREPYHIVTEMHDPANLVVAQLVGRDEARLILSADVVARIVAQTCHQSGLSVVLSELLEFGGTSIYMAPAPATLLGRTFGDSLVAYADSTVIGLQGLGSRPRLNPPMDTVLVAGDRLIVIAANQTTITLARVPAGEIREDLIEPPRERRHAPERTLILGWSRGGPAIVAELDPYVAPGSRLVVAANYPGLEASVASVRPRLTNQEAEVRQCDTADRAILDSLDPSSFDHVVVLAYADTFDPQSADATTLMTLLHLRDIAAKRGGDFSIVSEMLDVRNRDVAEIARPDDFIVSARLTSLLLAQVAENGDLKAIFDDLFAAEGSEIYIRAAEEYVRPGQPMTFATVIESARRRGEIAIGHRVWALINDATRDYGVVLNLPKTISLAFAPGDSVIVLAEGRMPGTRDATSASTIELGASLAT